METNKNTAIKQAIERKDIGSLSSNFIPDTMKKVRIKAQKKRRQKVIIDFIFLIAASSLLIALAVYIFIVRMGIKSSDFIPQYNILESSSIITFYSYIAILVLALLFGDYLLRTISKKKS